MSFRTAVDRFFSNLGETALRFENHKTIRAITEGLVNLIPLVLIGAICLAVRNLPIPALHTFLDGITFGHWTLLSDVITFATEDIIALAALLSLSYSLATQSSFIKKRKITPFIPMVVAFACYIVLLVWDQSANTTTVAGVIFTNPGRNGIIGALFVSLVSVHLFILFAQIWQKMPWGHWRVTGSHQQVRLAIRSVFPSACTLACFVIMRFSLDWLLSPVEIERIISETIIRIASEGSLPSIILSVFFIQVLWFIGAHGSNTNQSYMGLNEGVSTVDVTGVVDSTTMFANPDFYSVFVDMGGAGTTLALLIALMIFGSANRERRLARISIFPIAFNINETLVFGVPVVLNPFFLIPFVLAPIVTASVTYGAFSLGIVPPMIHYVEWTTPILFSGYMSTGSIAGSLLQLVCVALAFLIYAPFVHVAKVAQEKYYLKQYDGFKKEAVCAANNEKVSLAGRRDDIGEMTRDFITELNMFFDQKEVPFFLVFQPKTDIEGRVVGTEALLRWTHPKFGPIPPDILIELTDEADLSVPMGRWVTTQALEQLAQWREQGLSHLVMSINLNPHHIFIDEAFPEFFKEELARLHIDATFVEMEITEHVAVRASKKMREKFRRLRSLGVQLSIDDMGVGYSSLTYISDFGVSVVKIDVSLVDKVAVDMQQQEIVRSVVELARQLDLAVIVEGVETREQVEILSSLGCRYYQGYYFSKPLMPEDFWVYVDEHGSARLEHESKEEHLEYWSEWR